MESSPQDHFVWGQCHHPPNQHGHQSIRESEPVVWGQIFVLRLFGHDVSRESLYWRAGPGWFSLDSTWHRPPDPQSPSGGRRVNTSVFPVLSSLENVSDSKKYFVEVTQFCDQSSFDW